MTSPSMQMTSTEPQEWHKRIAVNMAILLTIGFNISALIYALHHIH